MRVIIEIDTGNAAFETDPREEFCRILRTLADTAEDTRLRDLGGKNLLDINGNTVGLVTINKTHLIP